MEKFNYQGIVDCGLLFDSWSVDDGSGTDSSGPSTRTSS